MTDDPVEKSILERLPDGRIRYRDRRGNVQTGEQVGTYAMRSCHGTEGVSRVCLRCDRELPDQAVSVDYLDGEEAPGFALAGVAPDVAAGRVYTESLSLHPGLIDTKEGLDWLCEQRHSGEDWTPFHHWLRERAS